MSREYSRSSAAAGPIPERAALTAATLAAAARVVERASRAEPLDRVLRHELRQGGLGLNPGARRAASLAAFAHYRWLGWLDRGAPAEDRIRRALELDAAFRRDPLAVSDAELLERAVPPWVAEHAAVTPAWLRALQAPPRLFLRARRGHGEELAEKLGSARAGTGPLADSIEYLGEEDLFRRPEFLSGEFEIQDLSSQAVGLWCAPGPGEIWWDVCAGEGGKLLHLSDLLENRGLVWGTDRSRRRLRSLKERAARARAHNYQAALWDGAAEPPSGARRFDGVLLDAPCTCLGAWGRNPDARWTVRPEEIGELAAIQRRLLARAAGAVASGGRLVYSVCTLTREETEATADAFEREFPAFRPWPMPDLWGEGAEGSPRRWIRSEERGSNGMFVAAWKRGSTKSPPASA